MYVSELQNSPKPQRLWYFGNCFRYERPQRGRFREFWQIGCELIGGSHPDSEAEAIALADSMCRSVGIRGDIHIGYLGLIRSLLARIAAQHRPAIMRMIDKKERAALTQMLDEIGCGHIGLLELLDQKGRGALDRAEEIVSELEAPGKRTQPVQAVADQASQTARAENQPGALCSAGQAGGSGARSAGVSGDRGSAAGIWGGLYH